MESAPSHSASVRTSFLPASPHPATPPINPPPLRDWNDTWWKRLLNVVTHLLWFVGLGMAALICHAVPVAQVPMFWEAAICTVAATALAFGFQAAALYVIAGSGLGSAQGVWIGRVVLLAVVTLAISGWTYFASLPAPVEVDEFAEFGGHALPDSEQPKLPPAPRRWW